MCILVSQVKLQVASLLCCILSLVMYVSKAREAEKFGEDCVGRALLPNGSVLSSRDTLPVGENSL
jgi:hypothetical protein